MQERMTDVKGNHFKMGVDDWDITGQCTVSLMTVAAVVKQTEGDKHPRFAIHELMHEDSFRRCSY